MRRKTHGRITLRDVILGGQDGLVNVLGIALGLFAAHADGRIILVAGLAAGFSEAVSMGAVAYTSARADKEIAHQKSVPALIFSSMIVAVSALIGSVAPLIPFLFLHNAPAIVTALVIGAVILFVLGIMSGKETDSGELRGGIEMVTIGLLSAFAGFIIGLLLKI